MRQPTCLVVGATGWLGQLTVEKLAAAGHPVRAFVRASSDPSRIAALKKLEVEIVVGDLRDRGSVEAACQGASRVVTTASATLSRQPDDSIASVDERGQLTLVEAAVKAGVERFVYVSFPTSEVSFPLQDAKRAVEKAIVQSTLDYTVLRPTFFREAWLGPMLGFDPAGGQATVYGSGNQPVSYIAVDDVAKFVLAAVDAPGAARMTFDLGGPDALSLRQVIGMVEKLLGRDLKIAEVPEAVLLAQLGSSSDPIDKSRAGLALWYARGSAVDSEPALKALPVERQRLSSHLESFRAPAN
ncbi:MAG: SDR family oxidoreductase [Polyangiaceae bacterium]|nr:SDR family oxidoreductase [Polyangiaceae bacterium]